jgi:predicted lipid-binding transport protein (Tim44 family)
MKYGKRFLTILFAMFMFTGALVVSAQAQGRVIVRRPVVVQRVYRPYWGARNWGYGRYYYDPFYADLYKSPYERYLEERYYAQRELAGNQKELAKHRQKYSADGVITAKEQKELNDDVKDVQKAQRRLAELNRYY